MSSYAQNQRQQEPWYRIYRLRCTDRKVAERQGDARRRSFQDCRPYWRTEDRHQVSAEIKQTEKEIAKLEAKKAATEAKAAEAAKKVEAEAVLKKLLASGMTADEILEKLK